MKTLIIIFTFSMLLINEAYSQTRAVPDFMYAVSDTSWSCSRYNPLACKAFGNAGEEAKLVFSYAPTDTIFIDAGDSWTFYAQPPKTFGDMEIFLYTLSAFPTDSAGTRQPYVKCIAYK